MDLAFEQAFFSWLSERGLGVKEISYCREVGGGMVHAYRLTPKLRKGLILFVHGAGNDALFPQVHLFKRLLLRDFEIFSFDLDGQGRKSTTVFSIEGLTGAVEQALDVALAECGESVSMLNKGVHVIGASLGGALTLKSLPGLSHRVSSAVILAAPMSLGSLWNALPEALAVFHPSVYKHWTTYKPWQLTPSFGVFGRERYPVRLDGDIYGSTPAVERILGFTYLTHIRRLLNSLELDKMASSIQLPVLLIYGGLDRLAPAAHGRYLHGMIQRSKFVCLKRHGHFSMPFSERLLDEIVTWLDLSSREAASGECL